jgi:hypothetical protein
VKRYQNQLRNISIATILALVLFCVATWMPTQAQGSVTLTGPSSIPAVSPGSQLRVSLSLTNNSGSEQVFRLELSSQLPTGWTFTPGSNAYRVGNGQTQSVAADFTIPANQAPGTFPFTIRAQSNSTNDFGSAPISIVVSGTTQQASFNPANQTQSVSLNTRTIVQLTLTNNSPSQRTFDLRSNFIQNVPGIAVSFPISSSIQIAPNSSNTVFVLLDVSGSAPTGNNLGPLQIVATSTEPAPTLIATAIIFFNISGTAATATPTPAPICQNGRERNDPADEPADAPFLLINIEQEHGICSIGDEDWFKFGGVGGKVYTIDITKMDPGLDLSLELYDENLNRLADNDDFFARTPAPAGPTAATPASDVRPRIQGWTAPKDGIYYIRVRDNLNIGGNNLTYAIIIRAESFGPTPATITEVCRDLFEEDGLPEQARLLTSNEAQINKAICPAADADWVQFFGKTGKTYYLYTDTRPYNRPDGSPQAGADTTLALVDRDGITLLAFNDDIENAGDPARNSLDSEIRFTPTVDGFYFAQVKNIGDVGNQFIRYDMVLKLCIPGQECGRSPVIRPTAAPTTPTPAVTPTVTAAPTPSPTFQPTASPQAGGGNPPEVVFRPPAGSLLNGPVDGFVDPAFKTLWERSDRPIAEQRATRSWMWGPRGPMARGEAYAESVGGMRQVQYFDKGRMEINDPNADPSKSGFVTSGLLVQEMVTGRLKVGNTAFEQRFPADVPVAGDANDSQSPRYGSFVGVAQQQVADLTNQLPSEVLLRDGRTIPYEGPQRNETRLVRYMSATRHNIPQVFWDFLNARGTVYTSGYGEGPIIDWITVVGYPITEPYWTQVTVGGVKREVLVQLFERRVLTYTPSNQTGWKVEQGNVGRHYYTWRYDEELP